ncbi:hypothetical protein F4820DRAFT_404351 [Hypoxylon rubiginosum]|uniref:Uncharacterized protein n=1 Tax=Hypoxylon rubiginosum TaxID=110542 RepID=A0ACB9ZGY9_9PEZI|nr:hypothetical protein F4820DRAFT_404351 [Hypoxylon rubiginosum]
MDQPTEQIQSELENFREQWRAEVSARSRNPGGSQRQRPTPAQAGPSASDKPPKRNEFANRKAASRTVPHPPEDEEEYIQAQSFDEPDAATSSGRIVGGGQRLGRQDASTTATGPAKDGEPQTALDFYETAVEKETAGKLGDSLQLYRKAFRMDDNVDQSYRNKHFPGRWAKQQPPSSSSSSSAQQQQQQQQVNPSNASATVPNTAHHSLEGPTTAAVAAPLSLPDLIASFSSLRIEAAPPECEGAAPPPCPIAALPDEILVHVLRDVAVTDVGDFARLARVCRRLAYLVATEDRIWRRVCLGPEFGFAAMHYHWQRGVTWEPLDAAQQQEEQGLAVVDGDDDNDNEVLTPDELSQRRQEESRAATTVLLRNLYNSSWQAMFRRRPRVRFNGCYISTVNYIRAGQSSAHQISWNTPVHIVTYYRYLRLFRDGTAVSLLTTDEPAHVVHHLTRDALALHRGGAGPHHLPSAVVGAGLRGRWRLSSSLDNPDAAAGLADVEGDLYVETEGVGPKYMYRMELTFRSKGGSGTARSNNNKLAWKGFWSYNKLTDDWAEFALKNDKPFFFSRVKSYGIRGER